jgi:hypothetical protein
VRDKGLVSPTNGQLSVGSQTLLVRTGGPNSHHAQADVCKRQATFQQATVLLRVRVLIVCNKLGSRQRKDVNTPMHFHFLICTNLLVLSRRRYLQTLVASTVILLLVLVGFSVVLLMILLVLREWW